MTMSNEEVIAAVTEWIDFDPNEQSRSIVKRKFDERDFKTLKEWFLPRIAFGTVFFHLQVFTKAILGWSTS